MDRLIIAASIVVVVTVVAVVARRARSTDAPTQRRGSIPLQLNRADFARPDAAWLVVVFSSATCDVCRSVIDKARVLDSTEVAVVDVEYGASGALYARYSIDAVPTLVIADRDGVVGASFIGSVTATDLWAAMAELRAPGTVPKCH